MNARFPLYCISLAASLGLALSLAGCTQKSLGKAFGGRHVEVSYDDLGTPAMLQPVLGTRGADPRIIISTRSTKLDAQPRHLNAYRGIQMLQHNERLLPHTTENRPLRERMRRAYSRIYQFYRDRRDAYLAVPPFYGRGSMGRAQMMPPVPSSL